MPITWQPCLRPAKGALIQARRKSRLVLSLPETAHRRTSSIELASVRGRLPCTLCLKRQSGQVPEIKFNTRRLLLNLQESDRTNLRIERPKRNKASVQRVVFDSLIPSLRHVDTVVLRCCQDVASKAAGYNPPLFGGQGSNPSCL